MTTYINFFAGPGAGKSTTAAETFVILKRRGLKVELITEYAKELEWEGNHKKMANQAYLFGKQLQRQERIRDQVQFAVTDSPILLGLVYATQYPASFHPFCLDMFNRFDNLNFFIRRVKPYMKYGRSQSEDEARQVDLRVLAMLQLNNIPYQEIIGDDIAPHTVADICTSRLTTP